MEQMKRIGLVFSVFCVFAAFGGLAPDVVALSPDGRNEIRLWKYPLAYEVLRDGGV